MLNFSFCELCDLCIVYVRCHGMFCVQFASYEFVMGRLYMYFCFIFETKELLSILAKFGGVQFCFMVLKCKSYFT